MNNHRASRPWVCVALLGTAMTMLTACPNTVRPPPPSEQPVAVPPPPASGNSVPVRPSPPVQPAPPAATTDQRGVTLYEVNPQASIVHIFVYRAGALARFGHNHVISVRSLNGRIWIHPTVSKSGFELSFPVEQMAVDEPQARRAAGSDFQAEVSASDREGTRANMLRTEVLDAAHYAQISLKSVTIAGSAQQPQVTVRITIRNVARELVIAPVMSLKAGQLTVSGQFDILQSQFGIEPFKAALGALAVQDRLHIEFTLIAGKKGG